jgi:hypothetical protein
VRRGQQRQHLVTDSITEELEIAVGGVLAPLEPGLLQQPHQGVAPRGDQRADHPPPHRRDAGQAADAGAFEQAHEHRLGLVLGRVPERDPLGADPIGALFQRRVPS